MSKTENITFRNEDQWLLDCLTKIVEAKRRAGWKTSLSYELIRLAKNGLTGEMLGAEADRVILRGKYERPPKPH